VTAVSARCSADIAAMLGARCFVPGMHNPSFAAATVKSGRCILLHAHEGTMWLWPVVQEMRHVKRTIR
jgi:hypothetical protein